MTTPTLPFMMDIVKVMASILQDGHQKASFNHECFIITSHDM